MSFLLARISHVVGQLITGRAFAAFAPFEVEDTEGRAVEADALAEREAVVGFSHTFIPTFAQVRAHALAGSRPRIVEHLGEAERDAVWRNTNADNTAAWLWMWSQRIGGWLVKLDSPGGFWVAALAPQDRHPYVEVLDHPDTPRVPPVDAVVESAGDGSAPVDTLPSAGADQPFCGDLFGRYGCNRPLGHDGPHELAHLHGCVIKRWTSQPMDEWGVLGGVMHAELEARGCVHVGKNTTS